MKKTLLLFMMFVMVFSGTVFAETMTEEQQLIVDAVNEEFQTEKYSAWTALYKDFTGSEPKIPEITGIIHYENDSFEGEKVDGYLVNVSADVAYWVNEEAQQGGVNENFQMFIDRNSQSVYDSITTDAANGASDTSTEEGRVTYLLWIYGNMQSGSYNGNFVSDTETAAELTGSDIDMINNHLIVETTEENGMSTEDLQLIADVLKEQFQSEEYTAWTALYKDFTGNEPKIPEIIGIIHYQNDSFEGEKVDGYLVDVSADVAYWVNEEAQQGAVNENFQMFIDRNAQSVYDSITTDAVNGTSDTSTEEGRATYLLWIYSNMQSGSDNTNFVNAMETVTELTEAEVAAISLAVEQ